LGSGGDGIVFQYRHRVSEEIIAVKTSRATGYRSVRGILAEIKQYEILGAHENICAMLAYCKDFRPNRSPAIFFPVCNWDLRGYKTQWHAQQKRKTGKSDGMPEITVMKLMRDISLGLNFLHNGHPICYVHNDIKPDNILVVLPPDYTAGDIPAEPVFKITDFGRTTVFPRPLEDLAGKWKGTYEYAPPRAERTLPPKPGVDVWALGATMQKFALDLNPTESRMAVIRRRQLARQEHPHVNDDKEWGNQFWRAQRNVLYRPINLPYQTLCLEYDVPTREPEYYRQYSTNLSHWYDMIMRTPAKFRVTSSFLAKIAVPFLDRQMAIERQMALSRKSFATAAALL
ncbi:kinase-like domain-containing protein, partial [Ampelomyces quisqualis]